MERKTHWKNFLLLAVGGLLALHINVSHAADSSTAASGSTNSTKSTVPTEDCVLEAE